MSEKDRKKTFRFDDDFCNPDDDTVHSRSTRPIASRRIRKVSPLGMRVLVAIKKEANVTDTGLYLPEGSRSSTSESILAEVIEVASAMDDHSEEETNVSGIPLGATVLIRKDAGVRIPWDENLRIVDTKDILCLVNEISLS